MENLTSKQWQNLKSFIVDSNNHLNSPFPSFNNLYKELSSSFQLVNNFSDHFSFHIVNCKEKKSRTLTSVILTRFSKTVIVIFDTSIKNNIVTLIPHVCSGCNILAKTIHHTIKITSTEAELFATRYDIDQTVKVFHTTLTIVITNAIHSIR